MTEQEEFEKKIKNKILKILEKQDFDIAVSDVHRALGEEPALGTVSRYLAILEAEKKVLKRTLGCSTLYRINKEGDNEKD